MNRIKLTTAIIFILCISIGSIANAASSGERYKQNGMNKYMRKNYAGAVVDFDKYLAINPSDVSVIFLRGLSKSLLKPEDVIGACADFLVVKPHVKDLNMDKYCAGQAGWQ